MAKKEGTPKAKRIALVTGGYALVDEYNFDRLNQYKWRRCGFCGHVFRTVKIGSWNWSIVYLASDVVGKPEMWHRGSCSPCPAFPD